MFAYRQKEEMGIACTQFERKSNLMFVAICLKDDIRLEKRGGEDKRWSRKNSNLRNKYEKAFTKTQPKPNLKLGWMLLKNKPNFPPTIELKTDRGIIKTRFNKWWQKLINERMRLSYNEESMSHSRNPNWKVNLKNYFAEKDWKGKQENEQIDQVGGRDYGTDKLVCLKQVHARAECVCAVCNWLLQFTKENIATIRRTWFE